MFSLSSPFGRKERDSYLKNIKEPSTVFDLCIVGGGITGAAIARDAALRGLKVLLVEKDDFASGTSSRSSKLIHGGVRYLEQLEFKLVSESTRERARLWKNSPHLAQPIQFLFPVFESSRVPLWKLSLGLWLYDLLAVFRAPGLHKRLSQSETKKTEPLLRGEDLKGSITYWDGITNDGLLTLANILDAHQAGAQTLSRVKYLNATKETILLGALPQEIFSINLQDTLQNENLSIKARTLILATGPWTDALLNLVPEISSKNFPERLLAPTRGSHIVVPRDRLTTEHAIVLFHPTDGRVLFVIPWGDFSIVGTTDLFDAENPDHTHISKEEVQYLLEAANGYFPEAKLNKEDIISTWSGLRPLLAPNKDKSESQISRDHYIRWFEPGVMIVTGGKLTTHREMAEEAVELLFDSTTHWTLPLSVPYSPCPTRARALPQFRYPQIGVSPQDAIGKSEAAQLSLDDVRGICRTQMVLTLEDLFVRRTEIFFKEKGNGWNLLPTLKKTLCEELSWTESDWTRELLAYKKYLEKNITKPLEKDFDPSSVLQEEHKLNF